MTKSPDLLYLDNNATTRAHPEVCRSVFEFLSNNVGNPSSAHRSGELARRELFQARGHVSRLFNCMPENIVFGSGTTELNNWVIQQSCKNDGAHFITSAVEHSSVIRVAERLMETGVAVSILPVNSDGKIDLDELRDTISDQTSLVSIQWVNGETGVVQEIESISKICSDAGVRFHTDAAQALGKIRVDTQQIRVDFLTSSAHKLHGPQGVGALYLRMFNGFGPLTLGGHQEFGLRAGTENLPGIVGFGVAARCRQESFDEIDETVKSYRDKFETAILRDLPMASINGSRDSRVSNTSNIRFCGIDGEALVASLDRFGLRCSQSSACSSQIPEPSHVLRAMGLADSDAYSSVRFSFSQFNTEQEIEKAVELVTKRVTELLDNRAQICV